MSNYPVLDADAVDNLRNESELPHHWALRREFIRNHNGDLPTDRLICLSKVFVNVECMGLTYPDEVMTKIKELGSKVDKKFIDDLTYKIDESEPPPADDNNKSRSFYDMPNRNQQSRGFNRGFGGRGGSDDNRGPNERNWRQFNNDRGFHERRFGPQEHQSRQSPHHASGFGSQQARQQYNASRGFIDSPRPRPTRGFGNQPSTFGPQHGQPRHGRPASSFLQGYRFQNNHRQN